LISVETQEQIPPTEKNQEKRSPEALRKNQPQPVPIDAPKTPSDGEPLDGIRKCKSSQGIGQGIGRGIRRNTDKNGIMTKEESTASFPVLEHEDSCGKIFRPLKPKVEKKTSREKTDGKMEEKPEENAEFFEDNPMGGRGDLRKTKSLPRSHQNVAGEEKNGNSAVSRKNSRDDESGSGSVVEPDEEEARAPAGQRKLLEQGIRQRPRSVSQPMIFCGVFKIPLEDEEVPPPPKRAPPELPLSEKKKKWQKFHKILQLIHF